MPYAKGINHGSNKLTEVEALTIRSSKEKASYLSLKYGVHISMIYRIRNNEYWKHL